MEFVVLPEGKPTDGCDVFWLFATTRWKQVRAGYQYLLLVVADLRNAEVGSTFSEGPPPSKGRWEPDCIAAFN